MNFKTLAVLTSIAAGAVATAHAESNVKLYGVVDTGVYVTHSSNDSTLIQMGSGITKGNRWGLEGKEELGNGYAVFFRLEAGFDSNDGAAKTANNINYAFYRDSYLGINSPYGTINFGRTGALSSGCNGGIVGNMSPFGITWKEAQISQVFAGNISARVNNMVRYESPNLAGLKLFAQYSNGTVLDDEVSSQRDRYLALGATYRIGGLRLIATFDNKFLNDLATKTDYYSAYKGLKDMRTYNIGGSYDFGTVRMYLGYQYGQNVISPKKGAITNKGSYAPNATRGTGTDEGYDTNAVSLGTNIKLWGGELKGVLGYAHADRDYQNQKADVYQIGIGYKYPLSKRTYVYTGAGFLHAKAQQTTKAKGKQAQRENTRSFFLGMCHSF